MLQSTGSHRVRHNWETEQQQQQQRTMNTQILYSSVSGGSVGVEVCVVKKKKVWAVKKSLILVGFVKNNACLGRKE